MDRLDRLEELLDDYKGNILNETGVSTRTQDELAMLLAHKPVLTEAFTKWLKAIGDITDRGHPPDDRDSFQFGK